MRPRRRLRELAWRAWLAALAVGTALVWSAVVLHLLRSP